MLQTTFPSVFESLCFHYAQKTVFFFGIKIQHEGQKYVFFLIFFFFFITKVLLTTTKIAFFSTSYLRYNCVCVVTQVGSRMLVFEKINDLIESKKC